MLLSKADTMDSNPKHRIIKRLRLLYQAKNNPELQMLLMEQCQRDICFWFNHFCWTFDPREKPAQLPFVLYPYQETFIQTLVRHIEQGEDFLVEKSRDMGVSWLILLLFQYYWLFHPGSNFHLGSRKMESVDRKGDISTLFEKLRFNLFRLPQWMRPDGFNPTRHDNQAKLIQPANGNIITGESSNENFGRGGRYKAILFDEFPFWPCDDAAYASAGQSSPCRILVGTPYGKNNKFGELRFHSPIEVASLHWRLHPLKDETWYERQKARMTEDEVARELDINYHLSVRDRVFKQFGELHKSQLEYIPGKRIIRSWDFGYHCPACLFLQLDNQDRVRVLHEIIGHQVMVQDFARQVLAQSKHLFPEAQFEDVCDPAGAQKSDKSLQTSIEILNSFGVYPYYYRSQILDGLELIRIKLAERIEGIPGLRVDRSCIKLIEAFEGGYRYGQSGSELPLQEHPYEDVMDCLRYAILHKCGITLPKRKASRSHRPQNRYTGY